MKIELLEKVKHDGTTYEAEEVRVVPDAIGEYFCKNGWAKDLDGNVETGVRDTTARKVQPADMKVFIR
jgi:hypothetical protein